MPAIWPVDFRQTFQVDTFSEALGDGTIRSEPDTGPAIIRNRFSAVPDPASGQMLFTTEQWEDLKVFHRTTLLGGALPFEFPAQGESVGADPWLVRFTAPPRRLYMTDDAWRVSIELEIMP